jgi:hypothetical protein
MTKRKANPQPHRFTPGNQASAKPPGTQLVGIRIMVRPDQRDWLTQQPTTISETGRQAIDLLMSSRDGK